MPKAMHEKLGWFLLFCKFKLVSCWSSMRRKQDVIIFSLIQFSSLLSMLHFLQGGNQIGSLDKLVLIEYKWCSWAGSRWRIIQKVPRQNCHLKYRSAEISIPICGNFTLNYMKIAFQDVISLHLSTLQPIVNFKPLWVWFLLHKMAEWTILRCLIVYQS